MLSQVHNLTLQFPCPSLIFNNIEKILLFVRLQGLLYTADFIKPVLGH